MFVQLHRHCTLQGRCADVQSVILWSSRRVIACLCHYCLDFLPLFSYFWMQAEGATLDSGCLMFINRL